MSRVERLQARTVVHSTRVSVVFACLVLCLLRGAPAASEAAVVATYRFNDTLAADEPGAPDLTAVDPLGANRFETASVFGQSVRVYRFEGNDLPDGQQAGLVLATTGLIAPTSYSVEMVFAFDARPPQYRRVLDASNRTSDQGLYANPDERLELFAEGGGIGAGAFTNAYHHVVLVVDAGTVTAYLEGALQIRGETTAMNLDTPNNPQRLMSFFLDNLSGLGPGGEYSSGRIALVRVHDSVLDDTQVGRLFAGIIQAPSLTVALSHVELGARDTLTLTAVLSPGPTPALVDAYIVLQVPGDVAASVVPGGVVAGVVPIASSFTPVEFTGQVLAHTFTGTEPLGSYTVVVALTQAGTSNVIGVIQQSSFTFASGVGPLGDSARVGP
jgi:hypothetical protein